jgi:hypothetical protein
MSTSLEQLLRNSAASVRNEARRTGKSQTATITINGRQCTVTASPVRNWLFYKETNIKVTYTALGRRTCTVNFTYDRGRGVDQGLQSLLKEIAQAEFIAATRVPTEDSRSQVLENISQKMSSYTQPKPIGSMNFHAPRIYTFLENVKNFVLKTDLTKEEISTLKQGLRKLCGDPIIQHPRYPNFLYSINEWDSDPHCRNIALQAESLEILLDAKARGQVGLERNVPPPVKELGSGQFNTVVLAHTKPVVDGGNASGPIVLKPCDQSKRENAPTAFAQGAGNVSRMIGTVSGSYRRNKATAKVQDMFYEIGQIIKINVPRVIASVSAAEIDKTPCIAMEMLEGKTVKETAKAVKEGSMQFECRRGMQLIGEFVRQETWMQLQHVLTGQIDRYGDNVLLTKDGPIAIDHDLSFPTNPPRGFAGAVPWGIVSIFQMPNGSLQEMSIDGVSWRNYCMPPVIDRDMYNAIMAIDLLRLEATYWECGLTRPEIDAAMARASGLKAAANQLMAAGRVIEPDQWATSQQVRDYCNRQNSYAARHLAGK